MTHDLRQWMNLLESTQTQPIAAFSEDIQRKALAAFHTLADGQQGEPEILATVSGNNPLYHAEGVYRLLAEHIGDFTKRMAQRYCDRMDYGYVEISEKLRKCFSVLNGGYGLEQELRDSLKRNHKQSDKNYEDFVKEFELGAERYASAHAKLPVWNEAQWYAREAAVALGRRQFPTLEHHLGVIRNHIQQGIEAWDNWASTVTVSRDSIMPFKASLTESIDDDDDDGKYDHLPSSKKLKELTPQLAMAGQLQYDQWEQVDGYDEEVGGGGICHLIAEKMVDIIDNAGFPVSTVSSLYEVHVYCVAQCNDGVFEVDIPWALYERGGGYTWTKLPNVIFHPTDVVVYRLDADPGRISQYVEEWEDA
jgi:hypothetical protein